MKFFIKLLKFIRDTILTISCLVILILIFSIGALFYSEKPTIDKNFQGALVLNLNGYLADNRESNEFSNLLNEMTSRNADIPQKISTFDVVHVIRTAIDDDRITGIVLDLDYFVGGDFPSLKYIGDALNDFKTVSQKPIIAVADSYTQSQYLLASYADKIYMNSIGNVNIVGLSSSNLYFKELLEKLNVTPHVFRVGTYKAAVEPILRNNMSDEARDNLQQVLDQNWQTYVEIVANNREIEAGNVLPDQTRYMQKMRELKGDLTKYTLENKFITDVGNRNQVTLALTEEFGVDKDKGYKQVKLNEYLSIIQDRFYTSGNYPKIAVINVEGTIVDGSVETDSVSGDDIYKTLTKANKDDNIKAVILRVNSPGGSAYASEIIRQGIDELQTNGKPVVTSMGGMAASGGYWISSTTDYIVADSETLTGSIGIFGLLFSYEDVLNKVGVYEDSVSTSFLAEQGFGKGLSSQQTELLQLQIEDGYSKFLSLVSRGRDLDLQNVDKIAQGRVWTGRDALNHKLVDQLGDFSSAIEVAEQLVVEKYPELQDELSIEWLEYGRNAWLDKVFSNIDSSVKMSVLSYLGLKQQDVKHVKGKLDILKQFNDPQGQYLYCLTCGDIN